MESESCEVKDAKADKYDSRNTSRDCRGNPRSDNTKQYDRTGNSEPDSTGGSWCPREELDSVITRHAVDRKNVNSKEIILFSNVDIN